MNNPKPAPLNETQRMDLAHRLADMTLELDYPDTGHLARMVHVIAKELAGERVEEIYGAHFQRIDLADADKLALAAGEATCGYEATPDQVTAYAGLVSALNNFTANHFARIKAAHKHAKP